jgi:hypothetical protein
MLQSSIANLSIVDVFQLHPHPGARSDVRGNRAEGGTERNAKQPDESLKHSSS